MEYLKIEDLPKHLKKFVVDQNYERYTWEDQAVWRYIMRQLKDFLTSNAHEAYLDGLMNTGLSIETIPHIEEMNRALNKFGWSAIPISGFIPPAAFMEFQSLGVLPIASDIRTIDHILYTPAPDIVHESAGHAPILIDSEFSRYLRQYAEVATKAIFCKEDLEMYDAIRNLSDIKEHPESTTEQIKQAEVQLEKISKTIRFVSEAAYLSRMNWWTAEYGLIGDVRNPKIFGAGLLSSIGESRSCLKENVKKIPLTVECLDFSYDITEKQPQLFVAEHFETLTNVLEEMAEGMSYRKGGQFGLKRAIEAQTVNTIQLNSGIQISGVVDSFIEKDGKVIFVKTKGPSQISYKGIQLEGHGVDFHKDGYSTPIGKLADGTELSGCDHNCLLDHGLELNKVCHLVYGSGIELFGTLKRATYKKESLVLLTFQEATVKYQNELLFRPEWGTFDLAVGYNIPSVFGGPADREQYENPDEYNVQIIPPKKASFVEKSQFDFYSRIRKVRQNDPISYGEWESLVQEYQKHFSDHWLMGLELLELGNHLNAPNCDQLRAHIQSFSAQNSSLAELIENGLRLSNRLWI